MKDEISRDSTVVASRDQVSSDLGGEAAILDLKGGTYYGLDEVGHRIWGLIQQPRSVREIRDVLVEEYDVEPDRCERDVVALLQRLADEGLVEVR
ncbi:MAG: lasso peptide biosynthesis PqqD family chaperone [Actinomycetota bacterium]